MKTFLRISFLLFIIPASGLAQIGGSAVFSFLNTPSSARIASMGGTLVTVKDDDLNTALQNPAALNKLNDKYLTLGGVSYFGGIKFGDAAFAKDFGKKGTFDIWMHYANYGSFKEADETGMVSGTFTAADYCLSLGWGYQLNRLFSIGVNLKGIYSEYYIANSWGLAGDFSIMLYDTANGWTATILARNIGTQLKPYVEENVEPLPLEVLYGVSKKFAHVPARISATVRHYNRDLGFVDPNDQDNYDALTGEYKPEKDNILKETIRHFTFGTEIFLSK